MLKRIIMVFLVSMLFTGCGGGSEPQAKATAVNAKEAIAKSADAGSEDAQVNYLVNEANGFIAGGAYNEAAKVAEYVIDHLDSTSREAIKVQREAYKEIQKAMVGGS